MKKLLFLILFLLLPKLCFGAIGATCVWEFRSTATANMVNGGGYTSGGTDYSQQDAAQFVPTDLACLDTSTTLTSATGGFTAAMVGNIIHITAGTNFVVGWYEITVYTDTNTVTIDRTAASVGLNATAGTGYVGGALSLNSTLDDEFFDQLVAGNIVYIKAGTYTFVENVNQQGLNGTSSNPFIVEGYNSTRGDNPTTINRPTIAAGAYEFTHGQMWQFYNLIITITGTYGLYSTNNSSAINCKSTNSSVSANRAAFTFTNQSIIARCEGISTNGYGFYIINSGVALSCYAHDSSKGYRLGTSGVYVINSIADTCTVGIDFNADYSSSIDNTIYNCTTGILETPSGYFEAVVNNIITNCATGMSWGTTQKRGYIDYNCWNNTTDTVNVTKGDHDITANPLLTDPANGDFTLQSGSPCLDAGMQVGVNQGAVGDYKVNIGVDQDDVTVAGAGGGRGARFINN